LKRFVVMFAVVALVFAVSAGPAFASACACADCALSRMPCSVAPVAACTMPMVHTACVSSSPCGTTVDRALHESTAAETGFQHGAVAQAVVVQAVPAARACALLCIVTADARGAPHLTALLRI
jgi:hypothetical protein